MERSVDDYFSTALHIFEYCGIEKAGTLHVDTLMEKLEPFIKTNKSEYSQLRTLLDPEQSNPKITVTMLTNSLNKYSETQKDKCELDESFNLRAGPVPQDSDSGISSDGCQMIEELHNELREKERLAHKLRCELDLNDRLHDEAVAALVAERDSLRGHLNMLREENSTLTQMRQDYDEVSDRLCGAETALETARRQLEAAKRREVTLTEQNAALENDKLTLEELLQKSKAECHRINDMYASRQCALREQNENLRATSAELSARLQDQEELMHVLVKEKVQLEIELKDILNKSNVHRINQSIDVSYTEEQMLTALDSLNSDSKFVNVGTDDTQDTDFFTNPSKTEGRMSLFDEIKLSFSGTKFKDLDLSQIASNQTQTDIEFYFNNNNDEIPCNDCIFQCKDCQKNKDNTAKLESDLEKAKLTSSNLQRDLVGFQDDFTLLQQMYDEQLLLNKLLNESLDTLNQRVTSLEDSCTQQSEALSSLTCTQINNVSTLSIECQTESETASISTQAQLPCVDCVRRAAPVVKKKSWSQYAWTGFKSLYTILAMLCFAGALLFLYQVSHYHFASRRCLRESPAVPWRWFNVPDVLDFFFRIEYVGEIPM